MRNLGTCFLLSACLLSGCPGETPANDAGRDAAGGDTGVDASVDGGAIDAPIGADAPALDAPADAPSDAPPDRCGDGTIDLGEVCDDSNRVGGDGCRADCLGTEMCGDGFVDVGEWCPSTVAETFPITGMFPGNAQYVDGDDDGDLDIYFVDGLVQSLVRNDGTGHFGAQVVTGSPNPGVFGDLDGSPGPELIAGLTLFVNRGDGTFEAGTTLSIAATSVLAIGDFDGDLDRDLLALTTPTECGVFTHDGALGFTLASTLPCNPEIRQTLVDDLDRDGRLDVVFLHDTGTDNVTVLRGTGPGTFSSSVVSSRFPNRGALGDVDGDGDLDLMHAVMIFPLALMLVETELGVAQAPVPLITVTGFGASPELVDADTDGDTDIYAFGGSPTPFTFLRQNDGAGVFTDLDTTVPPGVHLADMSGDGAIDMVSLGRIFIANP